MRSITAIALVALTAVSSACATTRRVYVADLAKGRVSHITVTRKSGGSLEVKKARLVGDSIIGVDAFGPTRIAVGTADVQEIMTGSATAGRTAGRAFAGAIGFAALLLTIVATSELQK